MNPTLKYRAKLTFDGNPNPAYVNLTVKSGTAKFAIGFKDNQIPTGKLPTSVVLNVYADGNSTKSVAAVTLKLQVR